MRLRRVPVVLSMTVMFLLTAAARAQDDDQFRPGWVGNYRSAAGEHFRRVDDHLAFDWSQSGPDARLRTWPVEVSWDGFLITQAPGSYRLAAAVQGELTIRLADQIVLRGEPDGDAWIVSSPLELPFDYHPVQIQFRGNQQARLALFWAGPQFAFEPIHVRQMVHAPAETPDLGFSRGASLVRGLRCGGCHQVPGETAVRPAPSLQSVKGALYRAWLTRWFSEPTGDSDRKMPHFVFTAAEADALADFLFAQSTDPPAVRRTTEDRSKRKKEERDGKDPLTRGSELFLTTGCLACHTWNESGTTGLFSGGDLSQIAAKRPPGFFERWLEKPQSLNRDHHMPVFDFNDPERSDLAVFLGSLGAAPPEQQDADSLSGVEKGRRLAEHFRCVACHRLNVQLADVEPVPLPPESQWQTACLGPPSPAGRHPGYNLTGPEADAVRAFFREIPSEAPQWPLEAGALLEQHNCLACHARRTAPGLAGQLNSIAATHEELAELLPAMTPPSLEQVGDKLPREALQSAIRRQGPPYRDYLRVQMPRFEFDDDELQALVNHFIVQDRLPDQAAAVLGGTTVDDPKALEIIGSRLVTASGFGCTSCHAVGDVKPSKAPLNARGPGLSAVGQRIRRPWFDRFVRNPARIIPRMEMPAVRTAVPGVPGNDLDQQLAAVWEVLNQPGFQPPDPDPLRIVRQSGLDASARAVVISDVVRTPDEMYVKPLLLGLANRHNLLFDLERAALASWTIGDVAHQRTEGKSWYWQSVGSAVLKPGLNSAEFAVQQGETLLEAEPPGQFLTEFDWFAHDGPRIEFAYRLHFPSASAGPLILRVEQALSPFLSADGSSSGFDRRIRIANPPGAGRLVFRLVESGEASSARLEQDRRSMMLPNGVRITLFSPAAASLHDGGHLELAGGPDPVELMLRYETSLPVDHIPGSLVEVPSPEPVALEVVPGFATDRLPLQTEIMPTDLAWRDDGTLVIASLKGRVWLATDTTGDGLEDRLWAFSDELAAPYGLGITASSIDVVNKYAVLRLHDDDGDLRADRTVSIASGWGHTADYHDWAVGLPRDAAGNYYVALPCQQDDRSLASAHLRGHVLKLTPREPTRENPRIFSLDTLTAGHRFPMGIALRPDGELFVTDNQGNYNPFNELNHIIPGSRYGFINKLERRSGFSPPLTPPAISLPHPWTRSVNGICFLTTPPALRSRTGKDLFGPFEGHLIGCEYDTRRLVRMSLQRVGSTYQGAAYPFSYDVPAAGPPFLGPLCCAVSPDGLVYIGGIRDSGWGGSNNVGEIARLTPMIKQLPCGIAEVRAVPAGLSIRFTSDVDAAAAGDGGNYDVASYTRISTPAYGGPDHDRQTETIRSLEYNADRREVVLHLDKLKEGYVYEVHVKTLTGAEQAFFPAEAHYTMREIPR